MPQRVDCGVIIFTKKILKGKNLSLSSGFSDKFLTDISLGGAKEHLPQLYRYLDTLLHSAVLLGNYQNREVVMNSREYYGTLWKKVLFMLVIRDTDLKKAPLPAALRA